MAAIMKLTVDEVRHTLPGLEELRPLVDMLIMTSEPDPSRTWAGSGVLGTSGNRLVSVDGLGEAASETARREAEHLRAVLADVAAAIAAVAEEDPIRAAERFLSAAAREERRDRPGRAAAYAQAAHAVSRGHSDPALTARAERRRARALRSSGRFVEALQAYEGAYRLTESIGDGAGSAEAAIGAGNVHEDCGRWREAEESYLLAIDALPEEGTFAERWHALLNLHVVLRSRGELEECRRYLDDATAVADELGDETAEQFLENARGQLYMAHGEFQHAVASLENAISASTSARARITIRLNLAEALLAQGRDVEAAERARQAELEALVSGLTQQLPEVYRLLGRIAAASDNPDAFVLFERAIGVIESEGLPTVERARTLQAYAEAESRVGDREEAGRLRTEAAALYESLGIVGLRDSWSEHHNPDEEPAGTEYSGLEEDDG